MSTEFSENSDGINKIYICNSCDYKCSHKQHIKQHLFGKKHKKLYFNNVEKSVNNVEKKIYVNVEKFIRKGLDYGNIKRYVN